MTSSKSSVYLRQLDGLRALSVAAVAWSHWRVYWFPESLFPWAEIGVETFFVISGFLITGILLDNRSEAARPFILRQFYARRFLRIFPLFYATIVVALILQANSMAETWPWHAAYLSNFYFYLHGWHGQLSHFWSLAVEEQFYLCWPLLMIFLPRRFLLPAILSGIAAAPVFEMGMTALHPGHAAQVSASVLMPSCMDALGIGALLAYGARQDRPMKRLPVLLLLIGLAGLAAWSASGFLAALEPLRRLAGDCLLGWLVCSAAEGFRGPFGWLLQSAPVSYLGKISYGLYIIHNFAFSMWQSVIQWLGSPVWLEKAFAVPLLRILCYAGLTIGLASLSWHVFEKPINNLKRKFPYPSEKGSAPVNLPKTDNPNPWR